MAIAVSADKFLVHNEYFDVSSGVVFADTTVTDEKIQDDLRSRLLRSYRQAKDVVFIILA